MWTNENQTNASLIIVSGLPRSGTSMMMKMLGQGGLPILSDGIRQPDESNPEGYYEYEGVKQLEQDSKWLETAQGKCTKVVSIFLHHLPPHYKYKIIFMSYFFNGVK